MKPKLAIVRGHYFSKDELSFYEPLKHEFDITFFSSVKGTSDDKSSLPVVELPCLDGILDSLSFGGFRKIYGLANNLIGINLEFVFGLKKRLRGFDIVHSIDYNYSLTHQLAHIKKELGFKLVAIHWENIPFAHDTQPIARYFKYNVYKKLDGFFAMSERAKASLILEGVDQSKIFVTWYAVDTQEFRPCREEGLSWRQRYSIKPDDIVLLFVGRVRASKGVFELIYSVKRLIEDPLIDRKKLKVVIAGKGPGEKELDKQIKALGLEKNVIRIGFIPHTEMHFIHNMADIFILPSVPRKYWQEQLGLVFLEAMACGKPVVSTLSGSIPEVVGDAGILVQPNDHISLYLALKQLINEPDLYAKLKNKAIRRAKERFGTAAIAHRLREAYNTTLSKQ